MEMRALQQRWPVTDDQQREVVARLMGVVRSPTSRPRDITAASKAIISATKINAMRDADEALRPNRFVEIAQKLGLEMSVNEDLGTVHVYRPAITDQSNWRQTVEADSDD